MLRVMELQFSFYVLSTFRYPHRQKSHWRYPRSTAYLSISLLGALFSLSLVVGFLPTSPILSLWRYRQLTDYSYSYFARLSHSLYWLDPSRCRSGLRGKLWIVELALSTTHSLSLRLSRHAVLVPSLLLPPSSSWSYRHRL